MLDQCLSFGEGGVTAARVRDVLGVVGDDLYAEVLALVAERRPAAVFPLIERLLESGADLVEFATGAAELLRAMLMLKVGAEPEGLTEAAHESLERYRDRLEAGDLLRMLKLLADSETSIRRSASPRLVVETLLLRWAMMDRAVDLAEVISGAPADRRAGRQTGSGAEPAASCSGRPRSCRPPGRGGPAHPPAAPADRPGRPLGGHRHRRPGAEPVPRRGCRGRASGLVRGSLAHGGAAGPRRPLRPATCRAGGRYRGGGERPGGLTGAAPGHHRPEESPSAAPRHRAA